MYVPPNQYTVESFTTSNLPLDPWSRDDDETVDAFAERMRALAIEYARLGDRERARAEERRAALAFMTASVVIVVLILLAILLGGRP